MLILPVPEHGTCFHLFVSPLISFFSVVYFSEYRSFTVVRFITRYFIFLVSIVNGIFFPWFLFLKFNCCCTKMPFISSSCLIAVSRTSNTMLNTSVESGQPCLIPDLSGKALSFCPLSMIWPLLGWWMLPLFPLCWVFLSSMGAIHYQMFFPHLLIWSCGFCLCFCLCGALRLLICEYCTILASLGWIPLDHGVWSFKKNPEEWRGFLIMKNIL